MPFKSKKQWRLFFSGAVPGVSKGKAKEWARETKSYGALPEKVAGLRGRPLARLRKHRDVLEAFTTPDSVKNYIDAGRTEQEYRRKSAEAIIDGFTKLAMHFSTPSTLSSSFRSRQNGLFKGMASEYSLKAPGRAASQVAVNPRRNVSQAMNAYRA